MNGNRSSRCSLFKSPEKKCRREDPDRSNTRVKVENMKTSKKGEREREIIMVWSATHRCNLSSQSLQKLPCQVTRLPPANIQDSHLFLWRQATYCSGFMLDIHFYQLIWQKVFVLTYCIWLQEKKNLVTCQSVDDILYGRTDKKIHCLIHIQGWFCTDTVRTNNVLWQHVYMCVCAYFSGSFGFRSSKGEW